MIQRTLLIQTRLGLHARAAARLVRVAKGFDSSVLLRRLDGGASVDAKSILSILMLAAGCGTRLEASVEGTDEEAAMSAIVQLFADGFGETGSESST